MVLIVTIFNSPYKHDDTYFIVYWTGHLLRMPTDRLPRQVLYSQLPDGQRPRGRPRLRYKDTIKRNRKKRDSDTNSWKSLALQRDVWRDTIK